MGEPDWYKPRGYKHFDRAVSAKFLSNVIMPSFVQAHSFSPLIHYIKETKRYKPLKGTTEIKKRDIMYASHRDACILSYYTHQLNARLDAYYQAQGLGDTVIAYRSLGRSNYDFSAEVYSYAREHLPCVILAFDVTGFFDNLDHGLLKARLKRILDVGSLPEDWLQVLRTVTRFHYVKTDELKAHPIFTERLKPNGPRMIGTVAELKKHGIQFHANPKVDVGIPQGTPISAVFSNLYMMDFDKSVGDACALLGALYRRYSDDILVVCRAKDADALEKKILDLIKVEKLEISTDKTERTAFDATTISSTKSAQYLGFSYYPGGAGIRPGSLSRQWRKMKRAIRRTKAAAKAAGKKGKDAKPYTKKLRRKFAPLQFRNFSSYGRRSAKAFGYGEKITAQLKRLERRFEQTLGS
ncbi:MAG: reverse transcriptase/maturase family protein [Asticcacaulis sp.]|nr:reverse transcriptase/maturase family protein [Asticcacaulis sp.]